MSQQKLFTIGLAGTPNVGKSTIFNALTKMHQHTGNWSGKTVACCSGTSMYGVGELSAGDGGRYAGMGNTGIALNRTGFLNTLNPAAITRMDTACFTFDVGVSASYARYSFLSEHSSNFTGNPNRISMGFRVLPRWYALVGAAPYSSVGYVIQTEEEIEGMPGNYTYSLFEGTGGLYRCYVTNAFALSRQLSVGINLGMIAGTGTQSEPQESDKWFRT